MESKYNQKADQNLFIFDLKTFIQDDDKNWVPECCQESFSSMAKNEKSCCTLKPFYDYENSSVDEEFADDSEEEFLDT